MHRTEVQIKTVNSLSHRFYETIELVSRLSAFRRSETEQLEFKSPFNCKQKLLFNMLRLIENIFNLVDSKRDSLAFWDSYEHTFVALACKNLFRRHIHFTTYL